MRCLICMAMKPITQCVLMILRYFDNFYVGWGVKCLEDAFDPTLPEAPLPEFPSGPEVTEVDDPTPEEEAAVRAALQVA